MIEKLILYGLLVLVGVRVIGVAAAAARNSSHVSYLSALRVLRNASSVVLAAAIGVVLLVAGFELFRSTVTILHLGAGFCIALGIQIALWASGVTTTFLATDVPPPGAQLTPAYSGVVSLEFSEQDRPDQFRVVKPNRSEPEDELNDLRGSGWTAEAYQAFVRGNIMRWRELATGLLNLSSSNDSADRTTRTEYRLDLPEPAVIADTLFSDMLMVMRDGLHCAVLDTYTWFRLPAFRHARDSALRRGIKVRLIFVLDKPQDADLAALDVARLIYEEYVAAGNSDGRYEMRFLDVREYRLRASLMFGESPLFCIFSPGFAPPSIVFILDRRLTDLRLSGGATAKEFAFEFDRLWGLLPVGKELSAPDDVNLAWSGDSEKS